MQFFWVKPTIWWHPSFFYPPTITDVKQMFFVKTTVAVITMFVAITTFLAITTMLLFTIILAITKNIILNLSENNFCHAENDKWRKWLWAKTIQKHEAHPWENFVTHACLMHLHYLVACIFFWNLSFNTTCFLTYQPLLLKN